MKRPLLLLFIFLAGRLLGNFSPADSLSFSEKIKNIKKNLTINDQAALAQSEEALLFSEQHGDSRGKAKALILKANALLNLGRISEYKRTMSQAHGLFSEERDPSLSLSYYSVVSTYFFNENKLDSCLNYVLKTLRLSEQLGDKALVLNYTIRLQRIYSELNDFPEAIRYNNKATVLAREANDSTKLAECFYSRGFILNNIRQHDSALVYLNKALAIQMQRKDTAALTVILSNQAYTYEQKGDLNAAIATALRSYELRRMQGSHLRMSQGLVDLADYHIEAGKPDLALKYLDSCRYYMQDVKNNHLLISYYKTMSGAWEKKGNAGDALMYYKKAVALEDSLSTAESGEKILALQKDYEITSREDQIQLLDKTNRVKELELERNKSRLLIFGLLTLFFLVLLVAVFVAYRSKQRLNRELAAVNERINAQNVTLRTLNKELIESEENLTKANSTKDQLLAMISHDLYNPVTGILNYTGEIRSRSAELSKSDLEAALNKIGAGIAPIQDLLDNILQWARSQKQDLSPVIAEVNVSQVVRDIVALYQPAADFKNVKIAAQGINVPPIRTDRLMLYFVLRNVVNNAVKFTAKDSRVSITLLVVQQVLEVIVSDKGSGFSPEVLEKLNSSDEAISTHGSGIGLSVSRKFVKAMNGKITFKNDMNGGAKVVIRIPGQAAHV